MIERCLFLFFISYSDNPEGFFCVKWFVFIQNEKKTSLLPPVNNNWTGWFSLPISYNRGTNTWKLYFFRYFIWRVEKVEVKVIGRGTGKGLVIVSIEPSLKQPPQ